MDFGFLPYCMRCGLADSKLGVCHKPGKAWGPLCRKCWRKAKGLRNGHGYGWMPLGAWREWRRTG
jgi:hypothetical protein